MDKQKSVVYVVPSATIGGAETVTFEIAKHHDLSRFQATFILLRDGQLASRLRSVPGVMVRVCPFEVRFRHPIRWIRAGLWLRTQVRESQADLVHFTMAYAALFSFFISRRKNYPIFLWFQHGPVAGWMDWVTQLMGMQALMTNSQYTLMRQIQCEGRSGAILNRNRRAVVLPLGVSSRNAESRPPSESLIRIAMVTRLQEWKGIDVFMDAMALLRDKFPSEKIEARIYGVVTHAPGTSEYAQRVQNLAQKKEVELCLPVPSFSELAGKLDFLVNASIEPEPFGLTLIEAMHLGVVAVAPAHGGPLEIIEDQKNGVLFQPGSAQALASALGRLILNPELRRNIGETAKADAMTRFSAQRMVNDLERTYEDLFQACSDC